MSTQPPVSQRPDECPFCGGPRDSHALAQEPAPLDWIIARYAALNHIAGEGDDCDESAVGMWCQPCWDDAAEMFKPDTTYALYREADAEYARRLTAAADEPEAQR